jgi:uncharacterized protein (DUF2235 family)
LTSLAQPVPATSVPNPGRPGAGAPTSRNIVICCDGTGNQYGSANSNVVKLYWTLSAQDKQIGYYHPGVGTMGARNALSVAGKWWTKVRGLAFGYGYSDNIADVYSYLMGEYRSSEDKIFIFGFSRGAYTARALCGLLHMCGLLTPGNEALIPYALRLYKSNDPSKFEIASGFRATFSINCTPYFLGLWDTVSSVGWVLDPIHTVGGHLPYTATLPGVSVVRHAVSIDERRAFFRQNLIHEATPADRDLKQVWFAGVHSDVGGSYPEAESGLSKIALRWMLCEAQAAGLLLDPNKVVDVLGGKKPYVPPNPKGKLHKSLHGFWWLGEIWPKSVSYCVAVKGQAELLWKRHIRVNLAKPRFIQDGAHIHQSVFERMQDPSANYNPKNLPNVRVTENENACELAPRTVVDSDSTTPAKRRRLPVRPIAIATLVLLGLLAVCAAGTILIFTVFHSLEVPNIERPSKVAWLAQNWTDEQRHRYYHMAQGSELLPYAWFLALEQPKLTITGARPFKEDAYMEGFGFIPDGASEQNPDALPVGFARDDRFVDANTGQKNVVLGLTCAGCHTGELFFGDKAIRIDAGPSLIDLQKFTEALGLAITWTYYDPVRFRRFAHRVLGPDPSPADQALLRQALKYYLDTSFTEFKANRHLFPTPEGYGRTDALARIGNFVFGTELNNRKNMAVGDGPVNFPPVWDASWMDWVQYDGSIEGPMGRNVGEALGVRARINLLAYLGVQFQNTIRVANLHEIELLIGGEKPGDGVWSPKWPENILGKIDPDKAAKGEKLYNTLCLHCHQPPMLSEEGRKPEHWTSTPNSEGRQFFKVTMVPLDEIGTDPKEAQNFYDRKADSGPLGMGTITAVQGLKYIAIRVMDQAYADLKLTPEQQNEWNGYRDNELRAPLAYKARPHNGIWATPPYLHNGSVPNLYALLSPVSERPKVFYLGNKQFDPVHLGLNAEPLKGATEFRTDLPGNSNAGHEFNDGPLGKGVIGRKLSEVERMQLIEYLKTL